MEHQRGVSTAGLAVFLVNEDEGLAKVEWLKIKPGTVAVAAFCDSDVQAASAFCLIQAAYTLLVGLDEEAAPEVASSMMAAVGGAVLQDEATAAEIFQKYWPTTDKENGAPRNDPDVPF